MSSCDELRKELKSYIEVMERGLRTDATFIASDAHSHEERLKVEGQRAMRKELIRSLKLILGE